MRHPYLIGDTFWMIDRPKLLAVSGPLRGRIFEINEDEVLIGRVPDAWVTIDHKSVSRHHCLLRREGDAFRLRDMGSRNGTVVNGEFAEDRWLQHGDRVDVGNVSFVFLLHDEDISSLLSDIRLTEDRFDPAAAIELRRHETVYLNPEGVLAGADLEAVRNFGALLKLGATLQASQRLATLEEQALRLIMDSIPAEAGAILLTGSRPDQFLSVYGRNLDGSESLNVSRTVVAHVLETKSALLTNDVSATMPHNQTLIRASTRSVLCVPLMTGDRTLGVIYLTNGEGLENFNESHLQLLTAMSAMLALPLESARRVEWLENENRRLQLDIDSDHQLIGDSPPMKQVYKFISRVAPTTATVLIQGESGTGKELIAHAIHRSSPRGKGAFVAINCAALKNELLESELFGHEKGAFTTAIALKKGKFEIADGGTIFLDEIAELAPDLQAKLLRVLQEREFERIGGNKPIKVDVRVIAATNRDLSDAIKQGHFRRDLYFRLNVVSIESPPLRQRGGDIVALADYFAARYSNRYNSRTRGISAEAEVHLRQYEWPGNVRELQNAIERAVVLGESDMIFPEDLPEAVLEAGPSSSASPTGFHDGVREAKRRLIQNALDQTDGNFAEAARLLDINRTYLHRLMRNLF
jgi:Nif-specific regulatory protein